MLSFSLSKKSYHYQIYNCLEVKPSFHKKLFQKEKNKLLLWFLPGNFQVICGSMVNKNHQSPALTETPDMLTAAKLRKMSLTIYLFGIKEVFHLQKKILIPISIKIFLKISS